MGLVGGWYVQQAGYDPVNCGVINLTGEDAGPPDLSLAKRLWRAGSVMTP